MRKLKFDYYISGLILSVPLDQGYGTNVSANMYRPLDGITTTPTNHSQDVTVVYLRANKGDGIPAWLPSGVQTTPLTNYTLAFYNNSLQEKALILCNKWFYTGNVQQLCSLRLVSQAQFYFEACLADIADGGNLAHHKLSISLFGFYCQKVLGIEECKLYGTYDAFSPCFKEAHDVDFPVVVVITIVVVVVVVIILCCCIVCCVTKRKRKRRNQVRYLDKYVDYPRECNTYTMGSPSYTDEPDNGQEMALRPIIQRDGFVRDLFGVPQEDDETNV